MIQFLHVCDKVLRVWSSLRSIRNIHKFVVRTKSFVLLELL